MKMIIEEKGPEVRDRRLSSRYDIQVDAKISSATIGFNARAVDISLFGIRIESPRSIRPGDRVFVLIDLENRLELRGRVLWVLAQYDPAKSAYMMGIEIGSICYANREAVGLTARSEMLQELLYRLKFDQIGDLPCGDAAGCSVGTGLENGVH